MPIGGLGAMRSPYQGGLGRRPRGRYQDGGGPIPTPENLWNGAGAPEPGMIGYLDALRPEDRAAAEAAMRPPTPAPTPPTLEQQEAGLEAQGYTKMMVPAVLARDQNNYVSDTGVGLLGAPDESGRAALYLDSAGNAAPPARYGLGPTYGRTDEYFIGKPLDPGGQLNFGNGDSIPTNWQDFDNRGTGTGGGFFTIDSLFPGGVPPAFQSGSSLPSTNNYRLLGGGFNQPNFIMRNGQIIDLNHPWLEHPFANILQHYAGGANARQPAAIGPAVSPDYNYTAQGWPGSVTGWNATPYRQG